MSVYFFTKLVNENRVLYYGFSRCGSYIKKMGVICLAWQDVSIS